MRNLIIDIGNTMAKMGIYEGKRLVGEVTALTHDKLAERALEICREQNVSRGMYATVADDDEVTIIPIIKGGIEMKRLTADTKVPFEICYKTPETLGGDRIAAVAGAISEMGKREMMIVDLGTAITFEYIDEEGRYQGGAISPGIEMRFKAMNAFTGKLPKASVGDYADRVGKTTLECLSSGVIEGVWHEVAGRIMDFMGQDNKKTIIFTGGDHKYLLANVKSTIFARPNLVMDGIAAICALDE